MKRILMRGMLISFSMFGFCFGDATTNSNEVTNSEMATFLSDRPDVEDHERWVKRLRREKTVPQPFSGEMMLLIKRALELHEKEIGVPLENYKVAILDMGDSIHVVFIDFRAGPFIRGSRKEVPGFHVIAEKGTYKIIGTVIPK